MSRNRNGLSDDFMTFVKRNGTGMLSTELSPGSMVGGQPAEGRQILRPNPNTRIYCRESDLGVTGRSQCDVVGAARVRTRTGSPPVDEEQGQQGQPVRLPEKQTLTVRKRETSNYYDVINPNNPDKPVNTRALRKKEAEQLLAELTEGEAVLPDVDAEENETVETGADAVAGE